MFSLMRAPWDKEGRLYQLTRGTLCRVGKSTTQPTLYNYHNKRQSARRLPLTVHHRSPQPALESAYAPVEFQKPLHSKFGAHNESCTPW